MTCCFEHAIRTLMVAVALAGSVPDILLSIRAGPEEVGKLAGESGVKIGPARPDNVLHG